METARAPETIRTPRLTLRALRPDDRQAITDGVGNYDVTRWLSVVPYPYTLDDADAYIAMAIGSGRQTWAICDSTGLVGSIGYGDHLGYWLARSAWGKGYATEAGDALVDHVFMTTNLETLVSSYFHGNDRSGHVLRKLGFVETGSLQVEARALSQTVDAQAMELTRSRWQARRQFDVRTTRLHIRDVRDGDWRDLQRLGGVPEVARMLLSVKAPWSEGDVRSWIARATFRGRPGFRATIRLLDGPVIGSVGIGRNPGAPDLSCYYWLGAPYWGKGYATEAMRAFLTECYARFPDLDAILADHFADNPASGHVLRKLGFDRVGESTGTSAARLEPAREFNYRVTRATFRVTP